VRDRIYIVYNTGCAFVREQWPHDAAGVKWHHRTPALAWVAYVAQVVSPVDARDFIVVGNDLTGDRNDKGVPTTNVDWSDAHPAVLLKIGGAP
jgi:hypothetical protein